MKAELLEEPELEFAAGRHIDIRFGLMDYGPLGRLASSPLREIKLGIIGTPETVEGVCRWLDRCRQPVEAKKSRRPNLFPHFPGFSRESEWDCSLVFDPTLQRTVSTRELAKLASRPPSPEVVEDAVELFLNECGELSDKAVAQVFVCAPPADLLDQLDALEDDAEDDPERQVVPVWKRQPSSRPIRRPQFHDFLKARGMRLAQPLQMVRPGTYDPSKRRKQKARRDRIRVLQDDATRAWNFHTALYYKAGAPLWRLVTDRTQLSACFVGVSFYRAADESVLMTSMAQVFNERGDGVVVRGGQVVPGKDDRQPHLDREGAAKLLRSALAIYRSEHKTLPARIVMHKTSSFSSAELDGFHEAAEAERIGSMDLIWISESDAKLFRPAVYPPLRGTWWQLDPKTNVLYTRGSVHLYSAYPGLYIPRPLRLQLEDVEQSARGLAEEVMALTKMNWNNTQFDNRDPITIRAARRVGSILKHIPEGGFLRPRYAYYM